MLPRNLSKASAKAQLADMGMASAAKRRSRTRGRSEGTHLGIPHYVTRSPEFGALDGWALKLLIEFANQYNGFNNGNLSCTWTVMTERGWRSNGTLRKALKRLLHEGWLVVTRQGGRHRCSLYAITWQSIDDCPGKFTEVSSTKTPGNQWQKTKRLAASNPNVGAMQTNTSKLSSDLQ
jgi:hypothetical protein